MSHGTFHTDPWCPCTARKTKSAFWFAASFEAGTLRSQVQTSFWAHSTQGLLVKPQPALGRRPAQVRTTACGSQAGSPSHDPSPCPQDVLQSSAWPQSLLTTACARQMLCGFHLRLHKGRFRKKKKNKHKGNRKRKRHTRFCFINWKWLALWKPLFFGFRNLPPPHTKKSNSIEGHDYYTENCFPFIKHFCECELIILASILLLAGSKLSWTKKKKSAFKPEPFPSTNGCLWTSLLNLNPHRSVTWNVIISAHFNQFSHTWTEKEN